MNQSRWERRERCLPTAYEIVLKDSRTGTSFIGMLFGDPVWRTTDLLAAPFYGIDSGSALNSLLIQQWLSPILRWPTVRNTFYSMTQHTRSNMYVLNIYVKRQQKFPKIIFTFTLCDTFWYFLFYFVLKKKKAMKYCNLLNWLCNSIMD